TEPTMNATLVDWLTRMQFAARVEVTDRTGQLALLGATAPVPGLDMPVWIDPWPGVTPGVYAYTEDPDDHPAINEDYAWRPDILEVDNLVHTVKQLPENFCVDGAMASEAWRIEACRSRRFVDADERSSA